MKRNNKGFTLAELLIVVAVIAVLVAVAIPTFTGQLEKSRQAVDISNLRGAYAAARLAEIDQAVDSVTFRSLAAGNTAGGLQYWYNPESGTLTRATSNTATDVEPAFVVGKATGHKVVADTSQLPSFGSKIIYNRGSLTKGTAGSVDKGILVTYRTDTGTNGNYVIDKILFTNASGAWAWAAPPTTEISKATGLAGCIDFETYTTAAAQDVPNSAPDADAFTDFITSAQLAATTPAGGTAPYTFGTVVGAPTGITFQVDETTTDGVTTGNLQIRVAETAAKDTTTKCSVDVTDSQGNVGTLYFNVVTNPAT